jgi:hypothetical protein
MQEEKDNFLTPAKRLSRLQGVMQVSWNELADALGVSRQMLLRVRVGERAFSAKKSRALSELEKQHGIDGVEQTGICKESRSDYGRDAPATRGDLDDAMRLVAEKCESMEASISLMRVALARLLEDREDAGDPVHGDGAGDVKGGMKAG